MKTTLLAILLGLAAICLGRAEEQDAAKKDLALLQGEWSMISGSADGQSMPEDSRKQMKRVCKGNETTTTFGNQIFLKAKFTLDPSKTPKMIDYEMTDGFTKGKKQFGIYEINGDTFRSCFSKAGAERPKDFATQPGDGRTLSVWKRNKSAEPLPEKK